LTVDQIPKSTFYMLLLRYMEGDRVDILEEPGTGKGKARKLFQSWIRSVTQANPLVSNLRKMFGRHL
jgi:ribosomal protein L21E